MRRVARELGFAVLAWLMPFLVSVRLYPLKRSHAGSFELMMGITLAASTVVLGCLYLRRTSCNFIARGAKLGVLWLAANWLLDSLMFSYGPMRMHFVQYMLNIGVGYVMIPIITIGLGFARGTAAASDHAA